MEIWKDILGYEGIYQVSDLGRVKSLKRHKEKILSPVINNYGYYQVYLFTNGICFRETLHRLVYESFYGKTNLYIDHIAEGNKTDNRLCNLQAITQRENISKYHLSTFKTSKYTGVSWHKGKNKWGASIRIDKIQKHLGYFITEIEAANAYKAKLSELSINA